MNIKRYISIYLKLIKINLDLLTAYRGNFINNLISSSTWGIFSFVSILLLTSRQMTIKGWTRSDLIFLTASYAIFIGIFHLFFSVNFSKLANVIHFGQLESLLLKPIDSQFSVSVWYISFTHISRIIMGAFVIGYLLQNSYQRIELIQIINYFLLIGIGEIVMYSIWFMVMTITIWFSQLTNLVEVMFTVSSIGRYPKEIYQEIGNLFFVLLFPMIIPVNMPVEVLLKRPFGNEIIIMIFLAVSFFLISRVFWKFALRHYTSASG